MSDLPLLKQFLTPAEIMMGIREGLAESKLSTNFLSSISGVPRKRLAKLLRDGKPRDREISKLVNAMERHG